ncbi:substrate-binding domain-containing protein [Allofustis seminis]|uniref:substrate-binding domain-containing protein n=1 Tax=Allofustis seminis TaxID=166939 RepID=UPI00036034C6|nr:substrate-binding domain-containing protein [Allofustis seminis]
MNIKKVSKWSAIALASVALVACGEKNNEKEGGATNDTQDIHVISREDGSGTRSAFVEIVGIVDENKEDATTQSATIQNGTSAVIQSVAGDKTAIGYISLGSLNDSVKALKVNGVEATPERVKAGDYEIARNFNLMYGKDLSEAAKDFWNFIFSAEGQTIVEEKGFIAAESEAPAYTPAKVSGTISIVGSTSVEPVIQAISEAYQKHNPDVTFEITAPGSGAGVTAAIDGTADIGMASRDLKSDEISKVKEAKSMAIDGIAVIVNKDNKTDDLSLENIKSIYLGDLLTWGEL